jgi:transposase-like protein
MDARSSLSEEQREAAVALFEAGWGSRAIATKLGVGRKAVLRLHDRWRVRGDTALVSKPGNRVYSFELKLNAVQRYISGETRVALAKELQLSSPHLITVWAGQYRAQGEEGLRPKPKGRPRKNPETPAQQEPELQRLRRENERLRAEVAFLGKVKALRDEERR